MKNVAIVIFAKAPIPGLVKTRLASFLTPEECAELYKCFFLDIVASIEKSGYSLFVSFTPTESENIIRDLIPPKLSIFPQEGNDLGERMLNAARYISNLGKTKVILVGADIPALSEDYIVHAVKSLDNHELCIGPAYDGGYYLIGFKKPQPILFEGISWGTGKVLAHTLKRIKALGLSCYRLPTLRDVDTFDDLAYLHSQLQDSTSPVHAPNTKAYLERTNIITKIY